jgi:hypothetical protein
LPVAEDLQLADSKIAAPSIPERFRSVVSIAVLMKRIARPSELKKPGLWQSPNTGVARIDCPIFGAVFSPLAPAVRPDTSIRALDPRIRIEKQFIDHGINGKPKISLSRSDQSRVVDVGEFRPQSIFPF